MAHEDSASRTASAVTSATAVAPASDVCPICASTAQPFCEKTTGGVVWKIARCPSCGHGFVQNRPSFDLITNANETESTDHPLGDFTIASYEARRDARDFAKKVTRFALNKGDALDIGSGDGSFSYHLWKHGFRPVMIDLDARAEQAVDLMPGSAFERQTFEDFDWPRKFTAIVMSQVLEHALDPLDWLRRSYDRLVPGGLLAIAVPNFGGVYRVLGARDPFLIPPVHVNFFTARSLRLALGQAGFRVASIDSRSGVPQRKGGSIVRRLAVGGWNVVSPILNPTSVGIVLRAFATVQ